MGVIDSLMKRYGLVRLDEYGLTLTADDRIASTRPVLDDGFGTRIVGWRGDDLVAIQLETYPATHQAGRPATQAARPPIPQPAPPRARPPTPQPARPTLQHAAVVLPPVAAPNISASQSAPVRVLPQASIVAEEPPVEEDWEWEIAMARARAVADEVEQAVIELNTPKAKARTSTTQPFAAVAAPKLENTVPYAQNPFVVANWDESRTPRSVVKTVARQSHDSFQPEPTREVYQRAEPPRTIIPIPTMPRATEHQSRLTPVIRAPQAPLTARRIAKGTGQQPSEDTILTATSPANDDTTKPGLARAPQPLPRITRRFAALQK